MNLPALLDWERSRDGLHQIAQIIGAVRSACSDPLPNDLQYSLDLTATGFSSTKMRCGGALTYDAFTERLCFSRAGNTIFKLDVKGHTQKSLMHKLLAVFVDCGYAIEPSMKHITHDDGFAIDAAASRECVRAYNAVFTSLARFRAKLGGYMTPIVLWPHHFDIAFICFPSDQVNEHKDPQIAFGFAPFSAGLDRPYIYAYGWSEATGYLDFALTPPAQATRAAYTGLYAAYDDLRELPAFDAVIESMLLCYHARATALLR